jgi:hypothetical protein
MNTKFSQLEIKPIGEDLNLQKYYMVFENLDCDVIDLFVDQSNQKYELLVNGKKLRKNDSRLTKINHLIQPQQVVTTSPIGNCVVRIFFKEDMDFAKVFGVIIVDGADSRYMPLNMIERFCQTTALSELPAVYNGILTLDKLIYLSTNNVMGFGNKGLLVVNEDKPIHYASFKPENANGEEIVTNLPEELAKEFSLMCIDPSDLGALKQVAGHVTADNFFGYVKGRGRDIGLWRDYLERLILQCNLSKEDAEVLLTKHLQQRANEVYSNAHS